MTFPSPRAKLDMGRQRREPWVLKVAMVARVKLVAQSEGIFFDPVYTGKAFCHFLHLLEEGYFDGEENILFLHSGGAGGLFAVELPE